MNAWILLFISDFVYWLNYGGEGGIRLPVSALTRSACSPVSTRTRAPRRFAPAGASGTRAFPTFESHMGKKAVLFCLLGFCYLFLTLFIG
jgi:hypothetical protein